MRSYCILQFTFHELLAAWHAYWKQCNCLNLPAHFRSPTYLITLQGFLEFLCAMAKWHVYRQLLKGLLVKYLR